ncbi:MAG TPA: type II toxin-antitoxin system VapC family toxin [Candidatus Nanoarchaeia archaeon]|nr:type II toxin-antitoxin system VapC family toxin [Candidatus Nanoarchaeia archaeon]
MAREKAVIDACVLVKMFAEEADTNKALLLVKRHIDGNTLLIVPDIAFAEVLNALKYKGASIEQLRETNKALWLFQLSVEKINPSILEKAVSFSCKHDLTIYDAIYAALSELYDTVLITADEALAKVPRAVLLRNF